VRSRHPLRLLKELKPRTHMLEEMGAVIDKALEKFENVLSSVEGV
jgi:hypothetical protein